MGPLGYQGSKAAMKTISEADVVLAIGTRLGPFGTLPQYGFDYWPKSAKIIQIDTCARRLGLAKENTIGICGDAGEAAKALRDHLKGMSPVCMSNAEQRVAAAHQNKAEWEAELDSWSESPGWGPDSARIWTSLSLMRSSSSPWNSWDMK